MRIGDNPQRDKKINIGDYFHEFNIPVYISNLEGYFKDVFEILKLSIDSILYTIHDKTFVTVINNGSCDEVNTILINFNVSTNKLLSSNRY